MRVRAIVRPKVGTRDIESSIRVGSMTKDVALVIPTLNAARWWTELHRSLLAQTLQPEQVIIVDSMSDDGTADLARAAGYRVAPVRREEFDHGATRQFAVELAERAGVVVFLTQDAILAEPHALQLLLSALDDPGVAVAYGRQRARPRSGGIEAHARAFNYPAISRVTSLADVAQIGLKAAFCSNSFAAYRREALVQVGGFPSHTIFGEDTLVAAKLLLQGWRVAYCADACVYHSHSYSYAQEFRRYFDVGVMHNRERWMLDQVGEPTGEGVRFVRSELRFLLKESPWLIPSALLRSALKYFAYRLGRHENFIPRLLKKKISMNAKYWLRAEARGASRNGMPLT